MSNEAVVIPDTYKDYVYRITYKLLGKVAPLIPNSIKPNQITLAAFIASLTACFLLYFVHSPAAYLYWAGFNFVWYILDALDGIHARLSGQTSEYGAFLDHYFDNIFFIFMFTAFMLKFDLAHPIYITVIILRCTAATSIFLAQAHTGEVYCGRFSGGLELVLMTTTMLLSFFYPHFDLTQHLSNPTLLSIAQTLSLTSGVFMKLTLLIYAIGTTIHFFVLGRYVKNKIKENETL